MSKNLAIGGEEESQYRSTVVVAVFVPTVHQIFKCNSIALFMSFHLPSIEVYASPSPHT